MSELFSNTPFMNFMWDSITIESVLKFAIVYFFVIWIAVIVWVIKDISNRTDNLILQILSILIVVIFTPLGVFMYLLIRPGRTIFEKYYLEVEENLAILSRIIEEKTEHDAAHNVTDCIDCGKEIRSNWKVCPYCGAKQHKNQHHKKKKTD